MMFLVREMRLDDLPAVFSLLENAQKELAGNYGVPGNELFQRAAIEHTFTHGFGRVVLNTEGQIVGWLAWIRDLTTTDAVYGIGTYVMPEYRGYGAAKELRKQALQWCQDNGFRCIGTVAEGNEAGLNSVLKAGFRITGQVVEWRPSWPQK